MWSSTLAAIAHPRRLVPIAVLVAPLMASQHAYSARPWVADTIALGMVAGFLVLAPAAWRLLFGVHAIPALQPARLLLFPLLGLLPLFAGVAMTRAVEYGDNFLVSSINGAVAAGLFLVGGWGLGRDIELEQGLDAANARADALKRQAEAAELLAIRAHLDPHFLFNTLNAIAEWCVVDGEKAEAAILRLSAVLRQVMAGIRTPTWPLDDELAIVRDVLELHRVRDPDWFTIDWQAEGHGASIPPLLLLPIVENAIKHGPAAGHRGVVTVRTVANGHRIRIEVVNPGPYTGPREGGEGLRMVQDRLRLSPDGRAEFGIAERNGTTVAHIDYQRDPSPRGRGHGQGEGA
ncbi:MAG: histidine kinase [Myxococcota bacterium]